MTYKRVFVDEALMIHAGAVGFVCAISRCEEIVMLGDINQIPYIDRDHMIPLRFYRPSCYSDTSEELIRTYRCPVDVCYALREKYKNIHTMNEVIRSMRCVRFSGQVVEKSVDTLYLVYFQSDKDALIQAGYGKDKGSKVLTIHEAQGLTYKHIVCVRRSNKKLKLYDSVEHAVVAISRHTCYFVYYTDEDDAITRFVRSVNITDLERWNMCRVLGNVGYCMNYCEEDVIMDIPAFKNKDDAVVANLPHETHVPVRPVVLKPAVGLDVRRMSGTTVSDTDIEYLQQWYDDKMPGIVESCMRMIRRW